MATSGHTTAGESANGLLASSIHAFDQEHAAAMSTLTAERASFVPFSRATIDGLGRFDPETAARNHLRQALASEAAPELTKPGGDRTEFARLGMEYLPLTETVVVKFRQTYNGIPLYGSFVTVELGEGNELLGISSQLGDPADVNPVAKVSPAVAVAVVAKDLNYRTQTEDVVPRLVYYFHQRQARWRLAYILENVPVTPKSDAVLAATRVQLRRNVDPPRAMDYVVDAQRARVVERLPRTPGVAVRERGRDAAGDQRKFDAEQSGATIAMIDPAYNVYTYDFGYGDPSTAAEKLPGAPVEKSSRSPRWDPAAISAHANAVLMARYLREVLKRNNIDGKGGAMVSTVNCLVTQESARPKEWLNAYWTPNRQQMVYGQAVVQDGRLRSLAANVDVVAHEMTHGVTDGSARLEYARQSGALNESYSDIFGMLVSNAGKPDTLTWNWEVGEHLLANGRPFRDMSDPNRFGQPDHMRDYQYLPVTERGDWGGVHVNSGIHNKAAYNLLTQRTSAGLAILTPDEVAALFFTALTQYLSRTSQFSDSRRHVLTVTRSLFRTRPAAERAAKVAAVTRAFDVVGIR